MMQWNPWHGCKKFSAGCENCYVYRRDANYDIDSCEVRKNADFDLPLRLCRDKTYKLKSDGGYVFTCFTSDFFLKEADEWRPECFKMIKKRFDLDFFIVTKRICRFEECIPDDWSDGYDNVTICCTCENNDEAKRRLPIFLDAKIKHKQIICEPLLSPIDLTPFLCDEIEEVSVGGESGKNARPCNYDWVKDIANQCKNAGIPFSFHQTGENFVKDGKTYIIPRNMQHIQAKRAGLDT